MKNQEQVKQEKGETLAAKWQSLLGVPVKIILASSLVILNYFTNKAQERELRQFLKNVRQECQANHEAKEELYKFFDAFQSQHTRLCPIMIKKYSAEGEDQQYKTGLLINGSYEWRQAFKAIRQHLKLQPTISISFFCGGHLISGGSVDNYYDKYKFQDGILYIQYIELQSYG